MWEWLSSDQTRELAGTGLAWFITASLMIIGLAGCIVPVIPGHLIMLIGAIAHRLMLGPGSGVSWWTFLVIVLLLIISQMIEILSGAAGAKWFGGSKWGALGALAGGIVGLFFFPIGLLAGPLLGAIGFEMAFANKEAQPAMVSGVGSLAGTLVGMVVKVTIGLMILVWFLADVFLVN